MAISFCSGLGRLPGPHIQLLSQTDPHHHSGDMTTSSKRSLILHISIYGVNFQSHFLTLCFGWFHLSSALLDVHAVSRPVQGYMVLRTAGPGTPMPHHGHLLRTTVHWDLHQPLCLQLHVRAVPFTQSRAPKCCICACNPFSLQAFICIFSIRILFCFFLLYL